MKYILSFLGVLLIVGFMDSLHYASWSQNRATGRALGRARMKANLIDGVKLYAVGLLLIKILR